MAYRLETIQTSKLMLADATMMRAALISPTKAAIDADIAHAIDQEALVTAREPIAADSLSLDDSLALAGTAEPLTLDDPLLA